jgi:uncharacterized SAM-binding protein YcdF (DUF218 family)
MSGAILCAFVAATPAFSSYLTHELETEIPLMTDFSQAQAIVVLGADVQSEDGPMSDRLGPLSLERLLFAADAYRQLRLPVATSGGRIGKVEISLAELMKATLEGYFAVPVTWTENRSKTTFENALYTARILKAENINTIVLITQARDQARAVWSFERAGLRALPWSAPRTMVDIDQITDFLPDAKSFEASFYALHELLGGLYYRLRY